MTDQLDLTAHSLWQRADRFLARYPVPPKPSTMSQPDRDCFDTLAADLLEAAAGWDAAIARADAEAQANAHGR